MFDRARSRLRFSVLPSVHVSCLFPLTLCCPPFFSISARCSPSAEGHLVLLVDSCQRKNLHSASHSLVVRTTCLFRSRRAVDVLPVESWFLQLPALRNSCLVPHDWINDGHSFMFLCVCSDSTGQSVWVSGSSSLWRSHPSPAAPAAAAAEHSGEDECWRRWRCSDVCPAQRWEQSWAAEVTAVQIQLWGQSETVHMVHVRMSLVIWDWQTGSHLHKGQISRTTFQISYYFFSFRSYALLHVRIHLGRTTSS